MFSGRMWAKLWALRLTARISRILLQKIFSLLTLGRIRPQYQRTVFILLVMVPNALAVQEPLLLAVVFLLLHSDRILPLSPHET